jgi:hypothetical protein
VQAGIPIQPVGELLRHDNVGITHRVHARLAPESWANAAAVNLMLGQGWQHWDLLSKLSEALSVFYEGTQHDVNPHAHL